MKYIKGTQTYKLGEDDAEITKVGLMCNGDGEGIWVEQHDNEVVLQNHSLAMYGPSWGAVIPSTRKKDDMFSMREEIDVTALSEEKELTLHPSAWDTYLEKGLIDADGNHIETDDVDEACDEEEENAEEDGNE